MDVQLIYMIENGICNGGIGRIRIDIFFNIIDESQLPITL